MSFQSSMIQMSYVWDTSEVCIILQNQQWIKKYSLSSKWSHHLLHRLKIFSECWISFWLHYIYFIYSRDNTSYKDIIMVKKLLKIRLQINQSNINYKTQMRWLVLYLFIKRVIIVSIFRQIWNEISNVLNINIW